MRRPPVHVGVNLCGSCPASSGGARSTRSRALRALADRDDPDLRITLFALSQFADAHPELAAAYPVVSADLDGHRRPERVVMESTWLPRELGRHDVDLVHHAGGVVPPGPGGTRVPAVLTVHDLQPLVMPENFSRVKRAWLGTMLPRSVRRARLVTTPSEPASQSVVDLLGVPPERVLTVPHGVEPHRPVDAGRLQEVKDRYRLGGRTILYPAIPYLPRTTARWWRPSPLHPTTPTSPCAHRRAGPGRPDLAWPSASRRRTPGPPHRRIPGRPARRVRSGTVWGAEPVRGFGGAPSGLAAGDPRGADARRAWVVGDAAVPWPPRRRGGPLRSPDPRRPPRRAAGRRRNPGRRVHLGAHGRGPVCVPTAAVIGEDGPQ